MLLLVGLGNPGPRYAKNRHNVGFMAVDAIVRRYPFEPFKSRAKFEGRVAEGTLGEERIVALKPETYMNESGRAVGACARFHKIAPERVIVFHDELDLAPGKIRVKRDGGNAGHNGLDSISEHIGNDYWRVRIGIGHPGDRELVTPYVLSDFDADDRPWLDAALSAVAEHAPLLSRADAQGFMSKVAERVAAALNPPAADERTPGDGA